MMSIFRLTVPALLLGLSGLILSCKPAPSAKQSGKRPAKQAGHALWFDGQNDFLRTDKWLSGARKTFCIEAWVKPAPSNPFSTASPFLVHRAAGYDKCFRYDVEKNAFTFAAMQSPNLDLWVESERKVTTGGWHHVATVCDGRAMILYVNGETVGQTSTTAVLDWDAAYQGSFLGGNPLPGALIRGNFRGLLDEVRIWDKPRSADEIRAAMKTPVAPNAPGLAAYWNFDEGDGQTARDITGHGHDAQFGSAPNLDDSDPQWIRSDCPVGDLPKIGPAGHSLWFHGQGARVLVPSLDGLRFAKAITIEAWIRPSQFLHRGCLLSIASSPFDTELRFLLKDDGSLRCENAGPKGSQTTVLFFTSPVVKTGRWQHVAFVLDGKKNSVRVGGRSVFEQDTSQSIALGGDRMVAGATLNGSEPFAGEMDELRIWSVARTETQIREAMNRAIAPTEQGLARYWRFDEGNGKIARDFSPFAAHAQLGEGPVPEANDPIWLVSDAPITESAKTGPARAAGQNFALQFDGKDDYVNTSNAPELRLAGAATIEAWIKPSEVIKGQAILAKENANGGQNAYELLIGQGLLSFQVSDGTAGCCGDQGWFPATGRTPLEAGVWHHVAGVYDGRQSLIYLDGVLEGSAPFNRPIADVPFMVRIGFNATDRPRFFNGTIDEVRLWNRARSQTEILGDMNRALSGNEAGLVGYWTFDEPAEGGATSATCQIAFDRSGHQNHGFLGGSPAREPSDPSRVVSEAPVAPAP